MAVNSTESRSQGQLHIHVECVQPRVQATLRAHAEVFSTEWKLLPFKLEGTRFWGMKTGRVDLGSFNLFASLIRIPGQGRSRQPIALAVFSAPPERAGDGFYVVAQRGRGSQGERLLDHSCELAQGRRSGAYGDVSSLRISMLAEQPPGRAQIGAPVRRASLPL